MCSDRSSFLSDVPRLSESTYVQGHDHGLAAASGPGGCSARPVRAGKWKWRGALSELSIAGALRPFESESRPKFTGPAAALPPGQAVHRRGVLEVIITPGSSGSGLRALRRWARCPSLLSILHLRQPHGMDGLVTTRDLLHLRHLLLAL